MRAGGLHMEAPKATRLVGERGEGIGVFRGLWPSIAVSNTLTISKACINFRLARAVQMPHYPACTWGNSMGTRHSLPRIGRSAIDHATHKGVVLIGELLIGADSIHSAK